jgi:hypothetical protein
MKQAPPWKVGLPFFIGAIIAGVSWFFHRQPAALLAAPILIVWGALWVWGARRSLAHSAREAGAPPFTPPAPGQAVVISRARRALSVRRGYAMVTNEQLLWWRGIPSRPLRPGDAVVVTDLALWGAEPQALASLSEIDHLSHKAAFIGGDTLTLKTSDGASLRLMLYDPEAFVLIMELFEKVNE